MQYSENFYRGCNKVISGSDLDRSLESSEVDAGLSAIVISSTHWWKFDMLDDWIDIYLSNECRSLSQPMNIGLFKTEIVKAQLSPDHFSFKRSSPSSLKDSSPLRMTGRISRTDEPRTNKSVSWPPNQFRFSDEKYRPTLLVTHPHPH